MSWQIAGTYLESCNCEAICPCRRISGVPGGRSTYGICLGALSWHVLEGNADGVDLGGLAVVLATRYDDDEEGSPWSYVLYLDRRGNRAQRSALEAIFTGRLGGDAVKHFPWAWKASDLLGVRTAEIELDHTPRKGWFRVGNEVSVRVRGAVPGSDDVVTCVIPGHDRGGEELVVDELRVDDPLLAFAFEGRCAYEATFEYAGEI